MSMSMSMSMTITTKMMKDGDDDDGDDDDDDCHHHHRTICYECWTCSGCSTRTAPSAHQKTLRIQVVSLTPAASSDCGC